MKKIIILFLILCNCLICNAAGISKEVLTANKWVVVTPDFHGRQIHTLVFNNNNTLEWNVKFVTLNKGGSTVYKYYFTDQMPSKFDKNKIGKAKVGRYLVFAHISDISKDNCYFICYEEVYSDKNSIEFRRADGEIWRIEKQ